jgi:hypothetical protein
MELIPIHEMQMPIKILSHERHVTYICVSKRGLCLGHGFLPKIMQAINVQNLHIINEDLKVESNVINNISQR